MAVWGKAQHEEESLPGTLGPRAPDSRQNIL